MADNDDESSGASDDGVGQHGPSAKQVLSVCLAVLGVVGAVAWVSSRDDEPGETEPASTTAATLHTANDSFAVFGCPPHPAADCSDYSVHRLD